MHGRERRHPATPHASGVGTPVVGPGEVGPTTAADPSVSPGVDIAVDDDRNADLRRLRHADAHNLSHVIISARAIASRVAALGRAISADYAGKELVCVGVLKGCIVFLGDLLRHLTVRTRVEFVGLRSYANTTSTGRVELYTDVPDDAVCGHHVLVVEDMVDTGRSMAHLLAHLTTKRPASLRLVVMFDKHTPKRDPRVRADYVGCAIPDVFVVGYGTDYNQRYRNLPFLGALRAEVYTRDAEHHGDVATATAAG